MRITALYKIWRGKEFLIPSIKSIYNHVDKIVFVSSDIGWNGNTGNNTFEVVEKYKNENDSYNKIEIIVFDTPSQEEQYDIGMKYIEKNVECDWVLLIDSDEVWDEIAWSNAKDWIFDKSKSINGFRCYMHTYIKDVKYRVSDEGHTQVAPVVFIRKSVGMLGIRGNATPGLSLMNNVFVHHFALVRDTIDEVFLKMRTSIVGDKHPYQLVDLDKWKREVWDNIPGVAYHYYEMCSGVWNRTIEINNNELPIHVREGGGYIK
jgi:hypothetical protein